MNPFDDEATEAGAAAYDFEQAKWTDRTNKGEKKPFEVCRFDDSDLAGSFSDIFKFSTRAEAEDFLDTMRSLRPMKAALTAATASMLARGMAFEDKISWTTSVDDGNNLGVQIEHNVPVLILKCGGTP